LTHKLCKRYTIVIVTHNIQQAARVADDMAFFLLGRLIEFGETDKIFTSPSDERIQDFGAVQGAVATWLSCAGRPSVSPGRYRSCTALSHQPLPVLHCRTNGWKTRRVIERSFTRTGELSLRQVR
jgi:ABC-type proline/glycine betaine transport system ATPase subunit